MAIITLGEQVSAIGYIACLERLLALEAILIAQLDGAPTGQLQESDSATLCRIADEMTELLSQCPEAATLAAEVVQRGGDSIHGVLDSAISHLPPLFGLYGCGRRTQLPGVTK